MPLKPRRSTKPGTRNARLRRYRIAGAARELEWDRLADIAAKLCQTPLAAINFLTEDHQFFMAEVGFGSRVQPLEGSFCETAVQAPDIFIVEDAAEDPRFAQSPFVTAGPKIRFYAGVPIRGVEGEILGALCVHDRVPRKLDDGQIQSMIALGEHISFLLAQRLQLRELDRKVRVRTRLLNMVSHDLRTPLSVISMGANLLRNMDHQPSVELAERFGRAYESMARLVEDLLDYDAIAAGAFKCQPRRIPLSEILDRVETLHAPLLERKQLRWVMEPSRAELAESGGELFADPGRVEQVLANLIGNAAKFTPGGGEIRMRTEVGEAYIRFSIEDTGPGVEPEAASSIFDPFWRAEATHKGVGLGLSIVERLCDAMMGSVYLDPEYREGARFVAELPRAPMRPGDSQTHASLAEP